MTREIQISDVTIRNADKQTTFREKVELAKLLDRLHVSAIELKAIEHVRTDSLQIKSIASAVDSSVLALPVELNAQSVKDSWEALSDSKKPRLIVPAAVSTVQMEYLYRKKPEAMIESIRETVKLCRSLCSDVEFQAEDATRSDPEFLADAIRTAIGAGATAVTLCDTAGTMLPDEFASFISEIRDIVPELSRVVLGVSCSDTLALAGACSIAAVQAGATKITAAAYGSGNASLSSVARMISAKRDYLGRETTLRTTELERVTDQIVRICETNRSKNSPFDNGVRETDESLSLQASDSIAEVRNVTVRLGYDLSDEDLNRVYEAFQRIAGRKEQIGSREIDAIVASEALQVPQMYHVESYVINAGDIITATAHITLNRNGESFQGVSIGDGPIDAAFLAIEQIVGHHYELDDFQIKAVTEGREAMGQTVVKLRSGGKVYSGRGISTDIIGASIHAYINALNKIVYEEAEE